MPLLKALEFTVTLNGLCTANTEHCSRLQGHFQDNQIHSRELSDEERDAGHE